MKRDMTYNIFIDDVLRPIDIYNRHLPANPIYKEQFVVLKSFNQFVKYIEEQFKIDGTYPGFISFDYLLAEVTMQVRDDRQIFFNDDSYTPSGVECAEWLVNFCKKNNLPIPKYIVHDINTYGKKQISKVFNLISTSKTNDPFESKVINNEPLVKTNYTGLDSTLIEKTEKIEHKNEIEPKPITESVNKMNFVLEKQYEKLKKNEFQELYWVSLKEYLDKNNSIVKIKKPLPQYWINIPMGRSGFHISIMVNSREKILTVVLCLMGDDSKNNFNKLKEICYDNSINEINGIIWDKMDKNKTSSYILLKNPKDFTKTKDWPNQFEWFKETLEKFIVFFKPIIKNL